MTWRSRLFDLSAREIVGSVVAVNVLVILWAAVTGNLPGWPPGSDLHVAEQTGTPIFTFAGADNVASGSVITIWNDISISNSLFTMWLVMGILLAIAFVATRRLEPVPGRFQGLIEMVTQGLIDFMRSAGGPGIVRFLPLFGTLLLLLVLSNWLSIVPFVGQIELLHSPTADYHINFGIAITSFVAYQLSGFGKLGPAYITRWFNFTGFRDGILVGVVFIFVGLFELFSELIRVFTLTVRLWANIWGGEVTLAVMSALLFIPSLPLPFLGLEIFIGFIQGFVFAFLVLLYIILALESHGEEHTEEFDHGQIGPLERAGEVAHA